MLPFAAFIVRDTVPVREQKIKRKKSKKLKIPLAFSCKRCYTKQAVKRNASFRYAAVAQLDRVTGYEPVGRGFESLQPYQLVASVISLATSFFIKTCHPLILLLLASKCDPFRWARIWQKADILWRSVDPFITRCKRHMACSGFLCPEKQRQDDSRMRRRGLALCRGGHWIFRQKIIPLDKDKAGKILYNRQCKAGGVWVRTKTRIGSQDHEV